MFRLSGTGWPEKIVCTMPRRITTGQIKKWARQLGFDLAGVAPAERIEQAQFLRDWLRRGYHGQMDFLACRVEQRIDPVAFLPWARSIICTAMNYYSEPPNRQSSTPLGRVARYAWRADYHDVLKKRLQALAERIHSESPAAARTRICVDAAPLAEKSHAARAGLGWIGKNSLLLNERFGSWLLLGEIITDLELTGDEAMPQGCGDCELCIKACPTAALLAPRVLDARRCISYLTIESTEAPPAELADKMGSWLFGCDLCQLACPYTRKAIPTTDPELQPRSQWCHIDLQQAADWDERQFNEHFAGSPIRRATWQHFQAVLRNTLKQS